MEGSFATNAKTRLPAGCAKVRLGEHSNGTSGCVQMQCRKGRITPTRRVLYFSMVLLIMLQLLKQFSQSTAYAISMWVMELMVLSLIAYEVIAAIWRHHIVKMRLKVLFRAMERGHKLLNSPPPPNSPQPQTESWHKSVDSWVEQTREVLRSYSSHAEASFMHDERAVTMGPPHTSAPLVFALLSSRVNNLRSIMEKPDVYF